MFRCYNNTEVFIRLLYKWLINPSINLSFNGKVSFSCTRAALVLTPKLVLMNSTLLILSKVMEGWWFVAQLKVIYWVQIHHRHRRTQKQNHCLHNNSLIKYITQIITFRTTLHRGFYPRLWVSIYAFINIFPSPVRVMLRV